MAIRIRNVNGELVALCAAETELEPGDLYFDDVVDSALREKFLEDYKKEGLIEAQAEPSKEWIRGWAQLLEDDDPEGKLLLSEVEELLKQMLNEAPMRKPKVSREFVEKYYEEIRKAIGRSAFTLPIRILIKMLEEADVEVEK